MSKQTRWQQLRTAADSVVDAAQPLGARVVSSADTALRQGGSKLPPQLQQRLGFSGDEARLRRRRRTTVAAASTVVAGLAAAETGRHGRELRQLSDELTRLTHELRELGQRRARERARRRRRKQIMLATAGIGAAGTTAAGMLLARRLRRNAADVDPHETDDIEPAYSAVPC